MAPSQNVPLNDGPPPASTDASPESPGIGPDGSTPSAGSTAAGSPPAPRRAGRLLKRRATRIAAVTACAVLTLAWAGTGFRYEPLAETTPGTAGDLPSDDRGLKQAASRLRTSERALKARLRAVAPRGVFIVIDQTHNRLYLKKGDDTLLEATCSTGSGMVLKEASGKKREWVFDTPRGRFEVISKRANPVWRKPDWAFVEEGEPIPKNPAARLDYGSLGEYALYFGNGYMIHGTLYERLLGRPVSHGCIRVGRDDLRKVWASAPLGTPIYIY